MKEWFIKRGYPESVIEKEMKKVRFSKQGQKSKKVEKGVPFVVTYHPLINKLSSIIHRNLYLLYMNQKVKNIFSPGPIMSCSSARKISSHLVKAKQCVRETTDEFHLRWNNYKSNDRNNARNEACMQEHLFEHFKSEGHSDFLEMFSYYL